MSHSYPSLRRFPLTRNRPLVLCIKRYGGAAEKTAPGTQL
jgi:hypothetical protein